MTADHRAIQARHQDPRRVKANPGVPIRYRLRVSRAQKDVVRKLIDSGIATSEAHVVTEAVNLLAILRTMFPSSTHLVMRSRDDALERRVALSVSIAPSYARQLVCDLNLRRLSDSARHNIEKLLLSFGLSSASSVVRYAIGIFEAVAPAMADGWHLFVPDADGRLVPVDRASLALHIDDATLPVDQ